MMIDRYKNIYFIEVVVTKDYDDINIHESIHKLIKQSNLIQFTLILRDPRLFGTHKGLKMVKEYNELIKDKKHLEYLRCLYSR